MPRVLAIVLLLAAIATMWALVAPIVLAAWFAQLAQPIHARLTARIRRPRTAAALLTAALVLLVLAPLALAVTTFLPSAKSLYEQLRSASGGPRFFTALVENGDAASGQLAPSSILDLVKTYGASA